MGGNPEARWFGFLEVLKACTWHETQSLEVPWKRSAWQPAQATAAWAPDSGKAPGCLKVVLRQLFETVEWQVSQAWVNPARTWFGVLASSAAFW